MISLPSVHDLILTKSIHHTSIFEEILHIYHTMSSPFQYDFITSHICIPSIFVLGTYIIIPLSGEKLSKYLGTSLHLTTSIHEPPHVKNVLFTKTNTSASSCQSLRCSLIQYRELEEWSIFRPDLATLDLHSSRLMIKPTKWPVRPAKTQISLGIHPVWSESLLCAQWVAKDPSFLQADSEDSDQTGRMLRLIWVFAGHTDHFVGFVMTWLIWAFQGPLITQH